ncbi:MAG: carboxypeptidase regulatory-like domain-containing protein [Aureispira sp.]|nr:carboxypeptidase regulatory-like domain-containing protein [Aureispira sp.]
MKIELSHDLIAKKVYETASIEDKARAKAEQIVKDRYIFSLNATNFYLSDQELKFVNPYVNEITLSQEEASFVRNSRRQINKIMRTARLKNYLIIGLVCISLFGSIAVFEHNRANEASELAQETTLYNQNLQDSIFFLQRDIKKMEENTVAVTTIPEGAVELVSIQFVCTVKSSDGQPIEQARINLGGAEVKTNAQGSFDNHLLVDKVVLGEEVYVQIRQDGYRPYTQKLIITDNGPAHIEATLEQL